MAGPVYGIRVSFRATVRVLVRVCQAQVGVHLLFRALLCGSVGVPEGLSTQEGVNREVRYLVVRE